MDKQEIGRKDVVIVRGDDGEFIGLINRCAHRGSMVVGALRGNAKTFECPYHGWSYTRDGKLLGIPLPSGYAADFDPEDRKWSLRRIARIDDYRGFIFVSLADAGLDLSTFLEPARDSLDNVVDRRAGTFVNCFTAIGRSMSKIPSKGRSESERMKRRNWFPAWS